MRMIEQILKDKSISYEYANKDCKRCHPGNAYQADPVELYNDTELIFVECDIPSIDHDHVKRIDHHRPGDYGYGMQPKDFGKHHH